MAQENIKLDIDFVRSQFPAFSDPLSKDLSFFENAGGSYVPKNVIDKLTEFMTSTKVQPYAEYPMSKIAGENMDKATELFAKMINAKNNEILIGGSTSINLYVLSNALKKYINPGDEVIVTNQDHEANISPWRKLEQIGAKIIEWQFNKKTHELEIDKLKSIISKKTNEELINVFVPTTPNPTSGFLLMFPIEDVIYLNMSFEEASKFIVSAGSADS